MFDSVPDCSVVVVVVVVVAVVVVVEAVVVKLDTLLIVRLNPPHEPRMSEKNLSSNEASFLL